MEVSQELSREEAEEDERTYLNVVLGFPFAGARVALATQCECLLERIEKQLTVAVPGENVAAENEQEVEASYLDMSGTNTPKANMSNSSASIDGGSKDLSVEVLNQRDDDALPVEDENSYDLTTDQILYDECQQDVEADPPPISPSPRTPTPESPTGDSRCPFGGLPASHLRLQQSPKHGTLFKQEKRLFFDQFKKYYVGLIGKWLLVYNSHNDLKPWQTIYIKAIKLDLNLNEHINEKHLFQIITHTDSKVHFLSPSFQDLNEWIVAIENNLIENKAAERSLNEGSAAVPVARKLPLPPCPAGSGGDETDRRAAPGQEDGIYEEPALYLKPETDTVHPEQAFGYDIPKPCVTTSGPPADVPVGKPKPAKNLEPAQLVPAPTAPPATPVKSWLKNKFNRSPSEPCEGKPSKKALKKLSFEELSLPAETPVEPKSPTTAAVKQLPPSPKFSLATTPSNKGTKINMIISQLEANGQLNLLSKRLTETNKRYTWVADDVTG
uniref:PH domain-containing protein n=1 Tax=Anopheles atroparvus TaxID=41427 RepID=A0A182JJV4_ANOAO